jgi:hypothetical protein
VEKLEYWKLCAEFTVVQAALIVCGIAPEDMQWQVERTNETECPAGYVAIRTALKHGLESGRIKPAKLSNCCDDDGNESQYIDIQATTISVDEINRFLKSSGVLCEFFDRSDLEFTAAPPLSTMPPKLAAAIKAWSAVSAEPARLRGKSPKQALEQWLIENADDLSLRNRDGTINRTGIEEICKVANWKPSGGATPTPMTAAPPPLPVARQLIRLPPPRATSGIQRRDISADLDDEIPF